MKPEELYAAMDIPESCLLGKRIFKKLFHENAALTPADKRAFSNDVITITWQYTLKPATILIAAYEDEEREYLEIAILECTLNQRRNAGRIAEVIQRAIPYPVVLVLYHRTEDEEAVAVSVAHKRMSRAERGAVVAEDFLQTPWLPDTEVTAPAASAQAAFLSHLRLSSLPQAHFFALYSAVVVRVLAAVTAALTGRYELKEAMPGSERRTRLDRCRVLSREANELRSAIKQEPTFARQVEMNAQLKRLEQQLAEELAQL
jgi:Domain of unknown function (DUF4391)